MSNSTSSNDSVFSAAVSALQGLLNRSGEGNPQPPEIAGVNHRVAILRVIGGRIVEQSGHDGGR